jgi:phosphatidylinositol glycan class S
VHPPPPANPLQPPSPLTPPLSRWQVETVLRQRMRENSDEARKTLAGISRLVKKIKEMQVGDGVRGKVLGAVEKLERVSRLRIRLAAERSRPGLPADLT